MIKFVLTKKQVFVRKILKAYKKQLFIEKAGAEHETEI